MKSHWHGIWLLKVVAKVQSTRKNRFKDWFFKPINNNIIILCLNKVLL